MLTFEQMTIRLIVALALGLIIGWERSYIGKEAGIRTSMLVSAGAALFTMTALNLPYLVALPGQNVGDVIIGSTFMNIISSIVVGIGFLGGGIIIKTKEHVHGLTTAAAVWVTAAIGTMVGVGLLEFSIAAGIFLTLLLYILRNVQIKHAAD